jgi:hypothetical protein
MNNGWVWDSRQPTKLVYPNAPNCSSATIVDLPMKIVPQPNGDLKVEICLPAQTGEHQ